MKCKNCGREMVCEDLGDNKKKFSCTKCGKTEILDEKGRPLLTE